MERILISIVAVALAMGSVSAVNCTARNDGVYEMGCRSYARCTGGQVSIIDCADDMVYNNNTALCDDPTNVAPPCGNLIDCTGKGDGQYPDMDQHCETWYTCLDEKFLGHNFCPEGTVFDTTLSTCNWKKAVAPPCGTL